MCLGCAAVPLLALALLCAFTLLREIGIKADPNKTAFPRQNQNLSVASLSATYFYYFSEYLCHY